MNRASLPSWPILPVVALVLACQADVAGIGPGSPDRRQAVVEPAGAPPPGPQPRVAPIDWPAAGDCLATLRLLHDAVQDGRLGPDERPPIAVVLPEAPPAPGWYRAAAQPVAADLPLEIGDGAATRASAAPCLLHIERARDHRASHRVLGHEVVRSLLESGVRSEKNPDYQVAEARLRQAERQLKDDGPDIIGVGDPLLDLVGVVVGGVLGAFSRAGGSAEVDQALAELAATPRSIDRPIYRPYHFEQTIMLGEKSATIPVTLVDRLTGAQVRTELRHQEIREFNLLDGLDPRDRDYQQHRAASVTEDELARWLEQAPELPLSTVVAALLDADPTIEGDTRVAMRPDPAGHADLAERRGPATVRAAETARDPPLPVERPPPARLAAQEASEDETVVWDELEPAAGPTLLAGDDGAPPVRARVVGRLPSLEAASSKPGPAGVDGDPRRASVVEIVAEGRSGGGFYVRPDLVLTTHRLVGEELVIDVITSDGAVVPGLVARTDPARDLALVQVPRPGAPVTFGADGAASSGGHVVAFGRRPGLAPRLTAATLEAEAGASTPGTGAWVLDTARDGPELVIGSPVFLGERVIGMATGQSEGGGPRFALGADALLGFLDHDRVAGAAARP